MRERRDLVRWAALVAVVPVLFFTSGSTEGSLGRNFEDCIQTCGNIDTACGDVCEALCADAGNPTFCLLICNNFCTDLVVHCEERCTIFEPSPSPERP